MTKERAIQLLKIEQACVESASGIWITPGGTFEETAEGPCDRDCANCKYVQDEKELLEMYQFVTKYLELDDDRIC